MNSVIVTGAFGTLGRAVVAELAQLGECVAGLDLAPAPTGFAGALALGGVDLNDPQAVVAALGRIREEVGAPHGLINVAGGFVWQPVETGTLDSWDRMYRTNLRSAVVATRAALPDLLEAGGAVVNIAAAGAIGPGTGMAPYAASKSGVLALTESLAEELRGRGVRVNAVLPTIIDTPANRADMPDADRSGWVRPESIAKVVAFLLSPAAGSVTGAAVRLSLPG
jgi:NAD(P)-dependent dehydrogenase (short-subunit alcohol dehydrogenase family)